MKGSKAFAPFVVSTCEDKFNGAPPQALAVCDEHRFLPFPIDDPLGLRNAIVPVFSQSVTGEIKGMGTAFHVDGFGAFMTAHHVVEFAEQDRNQRPILLLGMNSVLYGTRSIPEHRFAPATKFGVCKSEADDPIRALRGERSHDVIDIAVVHIDLPATERPHALPLRTSGWTPKPGEVVLAVGFPELDTTPLDPAEQQALLKEGMSGAYGRIIAVHPRGVSKSNPSPVLEVESDWPGGMSGGPVFNRCGEVIGIVSRSLRAGYAETGTGFAVDLRIAPEIDLLPASLRTATPGWRKCWATFLPESETPSSFHAELADAKLAAARQGGTVRLGENAIGSNNWIEAD